MGRTCAACALLGAAVALTGALAVGPNAAKRYLPLDRNSSGFTFLSEEYAPPQFPYGAEESNIAFQSAVAGLDAGSVQLVRTVYVDGMSSTSVRIRNATDSPIRTATASELGKAISLARSQGLSVALSLLLDFNWDVPYMHPGQANATHSLIGEGFTPAQWSAWFASYSAAVLDTAKAAAAAGGVSTFVVATDLDTAFQQEGPWRALVPAVRAVLPESTITVAASAATMAQVGWWDALDVIGWSALPNLTLAANGSADAVEAAWGPSVQAVEAVSAAQAKRVLVTKLGFQSRPGAWALPLHTSRPDFSDCSGWLECYDPEAQAQALEGSLRALTTRRWLAGVFVYAVLSDPSSGGPSDDGATPMGKPAAQVLQRWFGGTLEGWAAVETFPGEATIVAAQRRLAAAGPGGEGSRPGGVGVGADAALARRRERAVARAQSGSTWNGFVFGGPDEWSSPYYRYGSVGAMASLDAMAAAGANAVQLVAMRYYEESNSTLVYAKGAFSSSLMSTTGPELVAMAAHARSLGLRTMLSPMIDPDYDLPGNCRQCASPPGPGWRGLVGSDWGEDCSQGSPWAAWHQQYADTFVLPLARLAQAAGLDAFLISHELQSAVEHCPDLWAALLARTRAAFKGQVSVAFNPPVVDNWRQSLPWIRTLDFVGVDCYFPTTVDVPPLPWQDANVSAVAAAWEAPAAKLAALSAGAGDKQIVCTEIGSQSRPWAYSVTVGPRGHEFTPEQCAVWDQCHSHRAQAIFYDGMFTTLYSKPWFDGFTLWLWRADPTSGGPSDDAFTPSGKPETIAVLRDFWGSGQASPSRE
ncbi:hypothetical protein FNF28_07466 [Cafeteria roenbergensis]|uniref:Glycoside hydrolase family 5 domain-containing protein n=1 Tax=Cafeteria roenbergensis TaxID=33653 RepID=A0A5A8C6E0_CAFRO|nr:hypothetical protein FNF28_07466 [Cafeteria roenbergensis]